MDYEIFLTTPEKSFFYPMIQHQGPIQEMSPSCSQNVLNNLLILSESGCDKDICTNDGIPFM